jgi:hypothetical protein
MKTNEFRKKEFKCTADLWKFTVTTDSQGGDIRHFTFARSINLFVATSQFGRLRLYFQDSESDIVVFCQLFNLKDAAGQELMPNSIWTIDQFQPNINEWQVREGFNGRATYFGVDAG